MIIQKTATSAVHPVGIDTKAVTVEITENDIRYMRKALQLLHALDFADHNAITLSLKRIVRSGLEVRVSIADHDGMARARIGEQIIELGNDIDRWLSKARRGEDVFATAWQLHLPTELLKEEK